MPGCWSGKGGPGQKGVCIKVEDPHHIRKEAKMREKKIFYSDNIREAGIRAALDQELRDLPLQVLLEVDSTNIRLRKLAEEGAPDGMALIAGAQTAGKGRLGRTFYSPAGTGVYISLLLRQTGWDPELTGRITTMAAVAASEAIESVSGKKAGIKWVNDIYVEGKKVCGILAEGSGRREDGGLSYVILGAGFNVFSPEEGFPEELLQKAGAIFDTYEEQARENLTAGFLNRFLHYYRAKDHKKYVGKYQARCFVTGKDIVVITPTEKKRAHVLAVDENCHLKVRYEDGREEMLSSGEISIRPVAEV